MNDVTQATPPTAVTERDDLWSRRRLLHGAGCTCDGRRHEFSSWSDYHFELSTRPLMSLDPTSVRSTVVEGGYGAGL